MQQMTIEPQPRQWEFLSSPADIAIIDPDRDWIVDTQSFASKGRNTPLAGSALKGKVMATLFGGKLVYLDDAINIRKTGQA